MAKSKKPRDPLPDSFPSWREAAGFWDTHDTEDYAEYWKPLNETIEFIGEPGIQITLSARLTKKLQPRAEEAKVSIETLVNQLLENSIREEPRMASRVAEPRGTYRKRVAKRK